MVENKQELLAALLILDELFVLLAKLSVFVLDMPHFAAYLKESAADDEDLDYSEDKVTVNKGIR
uniref:Uncharacterized protein n=1 Tax=Thermogemmatispora argillosa TaxID=2045280 RepID=A0A455T6L1_9CHLR|nr:hypothetical protein KTA_34780 [Thermogemmatispora argillosa]